MHDLTQTIIDETTKITTSTDSYIFTCPVCAKQARYSYSFENKVEVFCDGNDLGTKVVVDDLIIEEIDAHNIQYFSTELVENTDPEEISKLESLGLIQPTEDTFVLTEDGQTLSQELSANVTQK
jgi:hypothetical protein